MPEAPALTAYEKLKPKQRAFVDAYLECGYNATKAAEITGYANPNKEGPRLMVILGIKAAIDERLKLNHLSADQVLARISDQAVSTIEDFLSLDKKKQPKLDLAKAKERGRLHLVQEIIQQTYYDKGKGAEVNELKVKLYNAQKSLSDLLRVHGLTKDAEIERTKAELLRAQLGIRETELAELKKRYDTEVTARYLEGRPQPQGGPGTGPCGTYHQALDPNVYPDGKLAQFVQPHEPCPVCGAEPFGGGA